MRPPLTVDADHGSALAEALADARLLLGYVVRSTRKVEPALIQRVTAACSTLAQSIGTPACTDAVEASFWQAYNELASAVSPVSASSIRQTADVANARLRSPTFVPVMFSVAFLIVVLMLQAYWVVGKSLRDQLRSFEDGKKSISQQLDAASDALRKAEARKERLLHRIRGQDSEELPSAPKPTQAERTKMFVELELSDGEAAQLLDSKVRLERELKHLNEETGPVERSLMRWYGALFRWDNWRKGFEDEEAKLRAEMDSARKETAAREGVGILTRLRFALERRLETDRFGDALRRIQFERSRTLEHRVDILLETLQRYVIPLLLGLLGALTYILRTLVTRLGDYTYSDSSAGLTFVRICLGMMAGVLGSIFVPAGETVLKTLPPLVIPFIFGYAVEMLFTFLDRAVGAFVTPEERAARG